LVFLLYTTTAWQTPIIKCETKNGYPSVSAEFGPVEKRHVQKYQLYPAFVETEEGKNEQASDEHGRKILGFSSKLGIFVKIRNFLKNRNFR
jgi:hypothetical protein